MSAIGARVRELRKARGLSQQALAGSGISAGYVSLIESGKRIPSPKVASILADRLGVEVDQLQGGEPVPATDHAASDEIRIQVNFARLALGNGDPGEAVRCLKRLPMDAVDSSTACDAALVLAEGLQETGQLESAISVLEALLERCRREESWTTLAIAATVASVMYIESGDIARSINTADRALKEVEAVGLGGTDEHVRLGAVFVWACCERGDLLYAALRADALIEVADRVGSARARGSIYWNAASVAYERGRVAEAIRLTDRAVALLGEQSGSRDLPRLRMNYAWLLLNQERPEPEEALRQLDRAESDPSLAGSRLDLGIAATFRARAYLVLGRVDDAAEHAARALQLLGPSDHVDHTSALILLGDVGTAQLDMDLAQEAFAEAERLLADMAPSRRAARLWRELGDGLRDLGETHRAIAAYDHGFRIVGIAPRPRPVNEFKFGRSSYAANR
jgi:transcriptional regulator with XRE-family HTH domain